MRPPTTMFVAATALAAALGSPAGAQERRSTIKGTVVTTSTLAPVAGAQVTLLGAGRTVRTDTAGAFRFDSLVAGAYLIQVRGLNDETPLTQVPLGRREVVELEVKLGKPDAVVLHELVASAPEPERRDIEAMRLPPEFVERKKVGLGQYITREEILERHPPTVADLFRGVRGMAVTCRNGICTPRPVRSPRNCTPTVVVDRVAADVRVLAGMLPGELEAIEIYVGMSTLPAEYLRHSYQAVCGMIVVWTRVPPQKQPGS
jgi:carboxypeptidase family protein